MPSSRPPATLDGPPPGGRSSAFAAVVTAVASLGLLLGLQTVGAAAEPVARSGSVDPVSTDVSTDGVLYRQSFDTSAGAGAPQGWEADGWDFTTRQEWVSDVDRMRDRFGRAQESIVVADPAQFGNSGTARLTSESIDVAGEGTLRLTFDSHYRGASGQSGVVSVEFDSGEKDELLRLDDGTVQSDYDPGQMNARQDITVDVPADAETVSITWEFTSGGSPFYWGIDSVALHRVQEDVDEAATTAWVVSDIQGHPQDFAEGLQGFDSLLPQADGLLMVGDTVDSGAAAEWEEIYDVMDDSAAIRPGQTIAAIGNHERYAAGGFEANRDRFLAFAERDEVWGEYVLEGPGGQVPVVVIGQDAAGPSEVPMSEEQLDFLAERLAYWTERDEQIVLISHFPLGDTVSASWIPWYDDSYQHNDRLVSLLANYPNVVMFSGHTHYAPDLGDWAVQRRSSDGHPDGFWGVNTLAMHVGWEAVGEDSAGIREVTTGDVNQGLTLQAHEDRLVVTAYDFAGDEPEQLREVTIVNPLVPFAGDGAGDGSDDDGSTDDGAADGGAADEEAAGDRGGDGPEMDRVVTTVTDQGDGQRVDEGSWLPRAGGPLGVAAIVAALALLATGGLLLRRRSESGLD